MKKIFLIAIFVASLGCFSLPSISSDLEKRPVRAGVFNFDGYHMKDDEGQLSGYGIDLLKLVSEYSNLDFILSGYDKSWQDMQAMLKNGAIDVLTSARRTPEREELFAYSLPVGSNYTVLSVQANNTHIRGGDYPTYDGMTIGVLRGSSQNKQLEDFARTKGFSYKTKEYSSAGALKESLQNGEVDAILSSNLRKPTNERVINVINADNFYIIVRKDDQELINEINYAINQMNINEGDWKNNLHFLHYGPKYDAALNFTERERNYINEVASGAKKIKATAKDDEKPYSYVEDGKLKGILPDFFDKVMELAGLKYEIKSRQDQGDQSNAHEGEVVLDRIVPVDVRENRLIPGFTSTSYMNTGLARVTRHNYQGENRTVAVVDGASPFIAPSLIENAQLRKYPSARLAMEAVKSGEADVAYVFPYAAQVFINEAPDSDLYYTMMNEPGADYRFYVPAHVDHELITILDKAIKRVPEGTLNHLISRHTSLAVGDMSISHYMRAHPGVTFFTLLVASLAASLLGFFYLRGRWSKRLLVAKENANRELEKQLSIVEALSRDYTNVFAINPRTGSTNVVKLQNHHEADSEASQPDAQSWDKLLCKYASDKVYQEDIPWLTGALALETIVRSLKERGEYTGIYRTGDKDGSIHHIQFTFVNLRGATEDGGVFILGGFRNIDEMIRRQQEQKELLAEALEQARYANAAKTAFLNNISHDIRTPMNAIIGFATLASAHVRDSALVKNYLGKITTSGKHLLSLINDVLDMSRIESGKMKIEEKEASLPEILQDLRTIVQADVKSRQLEFQVDSLNVVNETIFCDRLRLNQVLLNILSNAMKYTEPGGSVSLRIIQQPSVDSGQATFEFRIKDSGIGMNKEFLKHVFDPFEREQTSTVSGIQGTGLGLAITKKIVDLMGGHISVESEPGKGSEFTVVFTFRVPGIGDAPAPLPERFGGMRALVVDDDVNSCTSVSKMLSSLGLRPDWTTLGKEALVRATFALEEGKPYGVYIVDWLMPDLNGIEAVRRIRNIIGQEAIIIILTSYDWSDIEAEAIKAGVTSFCSKPVFLSQLKEKIRGPAGDSPDELNDNKSPAFAGKRILLAEDNEMNQEIAQMILEDAGFIVEIVDTGEQAVDRVKKKQPGHYDLVLMDVQMPVMDGYEATRIIRKIEDRRIAKIPIVAMTANAFDEDRLAAKDAGMDGYVAKPIDIKQLMGTLAAILENNMKK